MADYARSHEDLAMTLVSESVIPWIKLFDMPTDEELDMMSLLDMLLSEE